MDVSKEILERLDAVGGIGKDAFTEGLRIYTQYAAAESSCYFTVYTILLILCAIGVLVFIRSANKCGNDFEKLRLEQAPKSDVDGAEFGYAVCSLIYIVLSGVLIYMLINMAPVFANAMTPEKIGLERFLETLGK